MLCSVPGAGGEVGKLCEPLWPLNGVRHDAVACQSFGNGAYNFVGGYGGAVSLVSGCVSIPPNLIRVEPSWLEKSGYAFVRRRQWTC